NFLHHRIRHSGGGPKIINLAIRLSIISLCRFCLMCFRSRRRYDPPCVNSCFKCSSLVEIFHCLFRHCFCCLHLLRRGQTEQGENKRKSEQKCESGASRFYISCCF